MKRKKKTARTLFDGYATFAAYRESMEYFDGEVEIERAARRRWEVAAAARRAAYRAEQLKAGGVR